MASKPQVDQAPATPDLHKDQAPAAPDLYEVEAANHERRLVGWVRPAGDDYVPGKEEAEK